MENNKDTNKLIQYILNLDLPNTILHFNAEELNYSTSNFFEDLCINEPTIYAKSTKLEVVDFLLSNGYKNHEQIVKGIISSTLRQEEEIFNIFIKHDIFNQLSPLKLHSLYEYLIYRIPYLEKVKENIKHYSFNGYGATYLISSYDMNKEGSLEHLLRYSSFKELEGFFHSFIVSDYLGMKWEDEQVFYLSNYMIELPSTHLIYFKNRIDYDFYKQLSENWSWKEEVMNKVNLLNKILDNSILYQSLHSIAMQKAPVVKL